MDMPTKCIICGRPIDPAMVKCPKSDAIYPRELCDICADPKPKPAVKRSFSAPSYHRYVELAGAIMRGVLRNYEHFYKEALESVDIVYDSEHMTDEETRFIAYHKYISRSQYHSAITLGRISELLDSTRRNVENQADKFKKMKHDGYDIFKRSMLDV